MYKDFSIWIVQLRSIEKLVKSNYTPGGPTSSIWCYAHLKEGNSSDGLLTSMSVFAGQSHWLLQEDRFVCHQHSDATYLCFFFKSDPRATSKDTNKVHWYMWDSTFEHRTRRHGIILHNALLFISQTGTKQIKYKPLDTSKVLKKL